MRELHRREFACQFRLVEDVAAAQRDAPALADENRDLGWMLYDLDFTNPADPRPLWYRPTLRGGVIEVPARDSQEVRG